VCTARCCFISFDQILLLLRGKTGEKKQPIRMRSAPAMQFTFQLLGRQNASRPTALIELRPSFDKRHHISLCFISSSLGFVRVIFCSVGQRPARLCPHKKCNTVLFFVPAPSVRAYRKAAAAAFPHSEMKFAECVF
jgi:hypothetical protein